MTTTPLVSVITPCYAQAHFLPDAIESVLAQSYPSYEIIVVDDGSPDDVVQVVRAYPQVRLIRQENRGLSEARNRGLAECRGEFVVCLDADDRLLPNALAVGVEALSARPDCAFVWGIYRRIDALGNELPLWQKPFVERARYDLLLTRNLVGPPVVVMFRRAVLAEVGGFSPRQRCIEDYELYLRIARTHDSWCHNQLIAEYRLHGANMSLKSKAMLEGLLLAYDEQERWVGDDTTLRQALKQGRRAAWVDCDAAPRMQALSDQFRAMQWGKAIGSGTALLLKYPGLFLPVLARRVKRALLSLTMT